MFRALLSNKASPLWQTPFNPFKTNSTPLSFQTSQLVTIPQRNATKKAGGTTHNGRDSNPKYLGVKVQEGELVKIGSIIMRQRGTVWHAGEGVGMGKDHTLFALQPGFVRYTRKLWGKNFVIRRRRFIQVLPLERYQELSKIRLNDNARRSADGREKLWPWVMNQKTTEEKQKLIRFE